MSTPGRVLVFGSSFDPPTGAQGHLGIVSFFASRFDLVVVAPVYIHPLQAAKRVKLEFEHRLEMARLCFRHWRNVVVSDCERAVCEEWAARGEPQAVPGTMDVLEWLQRNVYPRSTLTFALGADAYRDLVAGKWKRHQELLSKVNLLVIQRSVASSCRLRAAARTLTPRPVTPGYKAWHSLGHGSGYARQRSICAHSRARSSVVHGSTCVQHQA